MPRKKREPAKPLPFGLKEGTPVAVTKRLESKSQQVGIVTGWCPKKDGGIEVWIAHTGPHARYVCIQTDSGDTILNLANPERNEP